MDKNRSLKVPSTMIKLPTRTGLPKFKILGNINNNNINDTVYSIQTNSNKHIKSSSTTSILPQRCYGPVSIRTPSSSQTNTNNVTSRIPSKPSALTRATPVSPESTTFPVKTNTNHYSIATTKPTSILRPTTSSKLTKPFINSTTIKKPKALTFNSPIYKDLAQQDLAQVNTSNSHVNTSTTTITTTSAIVNQLDLSILTGEVGEIRRLLEDLLKISNSVKNENETDRLDKNNNLVLENKRLKRENSELRETISAMKTSRLTGNSSIYYSPQT